MSWPSFIPPDLQKELENTMGFRSYGSADLWASIKEWLEKHEVDAPDTLPVRQRDETFYQQ